MTPADFLKRTRGRYVPTAVIVADEPDTLADITLDYVNTTSEDNYGPLVTLFPNDPMEN